MRKIKHVGLAVLLIGLMRFNCYGIELVTKDDFQLNLYGRIQTLGFGELLEDPHRDHLRVYLFLRQARLGFNGSIHDYKYVLEWALGGEEEVKNLNASQSLLDAYVDVPLFGSAALRMGQFKVPYSLERVSNSGALLFADRSIQNIAFTLGRDVGFALYDHIDMFAYTFGIFTGGGRDNPIRHIPERLGFPMISLRVGVKDGVDEGLFNYKQVDAEPLTPGYGIFAHAMYMKDSSVGHSTVLNVKPTEKNLLLNSNWNPYIGTTENLGDYWQVGGDVVKRMDLNGLLLSLETEGNYGLYKNRAGNVQITGGRIQGGLTKNFWGIALRYAFIVPDDKFASGGKKLLPNRNLIHEITPALTFFRKKNFKIVIDAPLLIDVPVAHEKGLGYYVLTDQPDQATYVTSGGIKRQIVPEGRLLLQFAF